MRYVHPSEDVDDSDSNAEDHVDNDYPDEDLVHTHHNGTDSDNDGLSDSQSRSTDDDGRADEDFGLSKAAVANGELRCGRRGGGAAARPGDAMEEMAVPQ